MITKLSHVRAIGDVHGHPDMLKRAAGEAEQVVLLGDLIDRGPDSPSVLRLVLDWIESGRAKLVRSNHDDKLYRFLKGRPVKIGHELAQTISDLDKAKDADELKSRFISLYAETPHILRVGKYVFAHAAVCKYHFEPPERPLSLTRMRKKIETMALYGETIGKRDVEGRPIRLYDWVETLPEGITAVVGHDTRGNTPFFHLTDEGRRAIFLDTGCGKGGPLSFIDLPSEEIGQIPFQ